MARKRKITPLVFLALCVLAITVNGAIAAEDRKSDPVREKGKNPEVEQDRVYKPYMVNGRYHQAVPAIKDMDELRKAASAIATPVHPKHLPKIKYIPAKIVHPSRLRLPAARIVPGSQRIDISTIDAINIANEPSKRYNKIPEGVASIPQAVEDLQEERRKRNAN